jgi:RNA polymerase sigma-70 factor (ECF subfamily)
LFLKPFLSIIHISLHLASANYQTLNSPVPTDSLNSEKELLLEVASGSEEAFRTIFHHYRGKLYHYILTITKSAEEAEDTVHDVFLKIWETREKLPVIENLGSYLYRMCYNHAISGFRRMAKETLILAELRKESILPLPAIDPISQKEIRALIQNAIEKLSPQQRKVFILSRHDGLKHEEIAAHLGISINTVRTHLGEALRFLREEIGQSYGPLATAIWVIYNLS